MYEEGVGGMGGGKEGGKEGEREHSKFWTSGHKNDIWSSVSV